jgi:hypothetical protein
MAAALAAIEQKTKTHIIMAENEIRKDKQQELSQPTLLLQSQIDKTSAKEVPRWLTVSPYPEAEHLLDLNALDLPNQLFALALTELEPATAQYATVKYEEALDWNSLMITLKSLAATYRYKWTQQEFYVVEFRSKLKENIDVDLLFKLDKESHIEATASGGLLKYWYGLPDEDRRNLATCKSGVPFRPIHHLTMRVGFWRNKEDAIKGGRGPWHRQARAAIPGMYEQIDVKGLRLIIGEDAESWSFAKLH